MTDPLQNEPSHNVAQPEVSTTLSTIIYVHFLANLVVPFAALVGVIMAYINKDDGTFLDTHYQFQIRTFWIGLLYSLIGILLTAIFIGWLILLFLLVWIIIRCAKGLKHLNKKEPMPDPTSWMFG